MREGSKRRRVTHKGGVACQAAESWPSLKKKNLMISGEMARPGQIVRAAGSERW